MSYTERVMSEQPGVIFGCLDNGDMVMDRDSGDFVPADQVIHDWDHIEKIDALDQDGLGSLRYYFEEEDDDETAANRDDDEDRQRSFFTSPKIKQPTTKPRKPMPIQRVAHDEGDIQCSRTVSVRKQSVSRNKHGKICNFH